MKKAVIGISGSVIVDQGGMFPGYRRSYVNEDYVNSVIVNGAIPFILPFTEEEDVIDAYINQIDGLILSGGHDLDPRRYGEETKAKLGQIYPARDNFDFRLLEKAKEKNLPILGICRGFQIINVFHGGSLWQDLSYSNIENLVKHDQGHSSDLVTHSVTVEDGSILKELVEVDKLYVNSFHHQIVNKLGDGLKVVARAADGVVESVELKGYPFLLGVQWHPEMLHKSEKLMNKLFSKLISEAKKWVEIRKN